MIYIQNQVQSFQSTIKHETKLAMMIRARISAINNEPVQTYAKQLKNDYFLFREQNLSSRQTLLKSENIVKGTWFNPNNSVIESSIEDRFARRLNIKLAMKLSLIFKINHLKQSLPVSGKSIGERLNPIFL